MSIYNVKIIQSPFHPNLEVAGDLIIKLHVPCSENNVTVKINPNLVDYKEKVSDNMQQFSVDIDTKETKTLTFDLQKNNVHKISVEDKNYEIKLMNIEKILEQGQEFLSFKFLITVL
jgi:hypothetical protein